MRDEMRERERDGMRERERDIDHGSPLSQFHVKNSLDAFHSVNSSVKLQDLSSVALVSVKLLVNSTLSLPLP